MEQIGSGQTNMDRIRSNLRQTVMDQIRSNSGQSQTGLGLIWGSPNINKIHCFCGLYNKNKTSPQIIGRPNPTNNQTTTRDKQTGDLLSVVILIRDWEYQAPQSNKGLLFQLQLATPPTTTTPVREHAIDDRGTPKHTTILQ